MPARRRKKPSKNFNVNNLYVVVVFLVAVFFIIVVRNIISRGEVIFTIAEALPSGDIKVSHVNLENKETFVVNIPKETEVNLALERGVLRASSIRKLVDSENLPGQFIADTITKTFHFPIDYWAYGNNSDLPPIVNIRTKIANISGMSVQEINLENTNYLNDEKLDDGEGGFRVSGRMPLLLQSVFADQSISNSQLVAQIINKTGQDAYSLGDTVEVMEILGVKVAPIVNEDMAGFDCIVLAKDSFALKRIAKVLNCEAKFTTPDAFDIQIILGEGFSKRF